MAQSVDLQASKRNMTCLKKEVLHHSLATQSMPEQQARCGSNHQANPPDMITTAA